MTDHNTIYVSNPRGAFSLPVGEVYLHKIGEEKYKSIAFTDYINKNEVDSLIDFCEKTLGDMNGYELVYVDRGSNKYYVVYPVFSPHYLDLAYIVDRLE